MTATWPHTVVIRVRPSVLRARTEKRPIPLEFEVRDWRDGSMLFEDEPHKVSEWLAVGGYRHAPGSDGAWIRTGA